MNLKILWYFLIFSITMPMALTIYNWYTLSSKEPDFQDDTTGIYGILLFIFSAFELVIFLILVSFKNKKKVDFSYLIIAFFSVLPISIILYLYLKF